MSESVYTREQLIEENKQLKDQLLELKRGVESSESKLENAEERFKVFFESVTDAIYLMDFSGTIIDANNVLLKIIGFKKEDLIGKNLFDLDWISKDDTNTLKRGFEANSKGLSFGPEKIVLSDKNGDSIYGEISTFPINLNGKELIIGIGKNKTEHKITDRILKENDQRFSLHVEQTPLGVMEWDLDYKVKKWNPAAEKIFGYSAKEAIGKHVSFIVADEFAQPVKKVLNKLVTLKGGRRSDNQNLKKNGETINCEWYNTPLVDDKGEVIAIASLVQDITEQVRSEQVQKVLYNISNAVSSTDNLNKLIGFIQEEVGKIIDTKNFFVALYNEKSQTMSLPFFVDEKDRFSNIPAKKTLTGYVIKTKKSLLATPDVLKELEDSGAIEFVGTNCKIWMGVPLSIEGKVIGALAVQSYIDENAFGYAELKMLEFVSDQISISIHRKKAEEDLIKALQKAEESDRLKTSFLQNVSHEIRTPMNGILGFTNLLKDPDLTQTEKNEYIRIIEKSGKRMLITINDLMDISKIESGQVEIELVEINVNKQIEELYTFFKPEAESKGLLLKMNKSLPDTESVLISDREKVHAVLTNLIKNAIKYSAKGSVEFGYKKVNNFFEFYVKDTGIGIPENKIDSVFDRFVQVDQRLSSEYEGTGLGLSISKAFVEIMEGKIWLESKEGKGSIFCFAIPNKTISESKERVKEKRGKTKNLQGIKNLKILVAEDDETIRAYLKIAIGRLCKEILFATNGIETVEAMQNNSDVDLILMDVKMPVMDGYEATQEIRKFNKDVVIFAQTAFAFETEQEKIFSAGCNDYISKPIRRNELIETIEKYFGN